MHRLAILVALVACNDRETTRVEDISARVCACKSSKCAEAALDELPAAPPNGSRRIQNAAEDARNCLAKLIDAEKPSPDDEAGSDGSAADQAK
jgi:hypothetical protein